jgi:hypothetical protein
MVIENIETGTDPDLPETGRRGMNTTEKVVTDTESAKETETETEKETVTGIVKEIEKTGTEKKESVTRTIDSQLHYMPLVVALF